MAVFTHVPLGELSQITSGWLHRIPSDFTVDSAAISINNAPITMFSPLFICSGNVYFETSKGVGISPIKNR
jgi:hypothetical protein